MTKILPNETDSTTSPKTEEMIQANTVDADSSAEAVETLSGDGWENVSESLLSDWTDLFVAWQSEPWFIPVILVLAAWTLTWDGLALWRAGRNNQPRWFIAILLLNTLGIFEILYLKFWQKKK